MVRSCRPVLDPSFIFIPVVICLMKISIGLMQSISPLLPILNEEPTDHIEDKTVTNIPVTFAVIDFCVTIVASIISDTLISHDILLTVVLLFWPPISMGLFITNSKQNFIYLIRLMAVVKGVIEPLILSIGVQRYNHDDFKKLYLYFMVTHCAYLAGSVGVRTIIRIDIIENNICGNMSCIDLACLIGTISGFVSLMCYVMGSSYFTKETDEAINYYTVILKICCLLVAYIPYIIFWIFYQRIEPQVAHLPLLVNMYFVNAYGMPKLFLEMKLIFAIIYFIIYKIFELQIIKYSVALMTVGGILVGLWPIMATNMVDDHHDQYMQAGPVKPDAIQITYFCPDNNQLLVDIPYFQDPLCNLAGHSAFTIKRDQILVLRQKTLCPYIIFEKNTINQCFKRGNRYFVAMCKQGTGAAFNDIARRDPEGGAVVCIMLMRETKCRENTQSINVTLYHNVPTKNDARQYSYMLPSNYLTENNATDSPWREFCQTIEPGNEYNIIIEGRKVAQNFTFGPGGVYYFSGLISSDDYWNITSVDPYKSTLINTPLLWMSILRAIGEYLLIINGFFSVFIFIKPKCRTIAIAIWLMMIKFGSMIYAIDHNNDIYFQHGDLNKLGGILISMPILSYVMQCFCRREGVSEEKEI